MVKLRLARGGYKKAPFYRIVVANSRNARDGRFIERIGFFNPIVLGKNVDFHINVERAKYWLSQGAIPSVRVSTLLKRIMKK